MPKIDPAYCPKCGAAGHQIFPHKYTCGSDYGVAWFIRSVDCFNRQIAAQARELEAAREFITNTINFIKIGLISLSDNPPIRKIDIMVIVDTITKTLAAYDKLKEERKDV